MGILQARTLEWVAVLSSRDSSQPRDRTQVSHIVDGFFTMWATRDTRVNTKTIELNCALVMGGLYGIFNSTSVKLF